MKKFINCLMTVRLMSSLLGTGSSNASSLSYDPDKHENPTVVKFKQARAVYAKSGQTGRAALSAFFLEDLLAPIAGIGTGSETLV